MTEKESKKFKADAIRRGLTKKQINTTFLQKGLLITCFILLVSASVTPNIIAASTVAQSPQKNDVSFTLYLCENNRVKKQTVLLSYSDANLIKKTFQDLNDLMMRDSFSGQMKRLQQKLIDLLEKNKLLADGVTREEIQILLNICDETSQETNYPSSLTNKSPVQKSLSRKIYGTGPCTVGSFGGWDNSGLYLLLFPLPRPRLIMPWIGNGGTGIQQPGARTEIIASGKQAGISLGFIGIIFVFPVSESDGLGVYYGFIGRSIFTVVIADSIDEIQLPH
jgi:hypothetical protein